jgi:hypothetical protein
LSLAPPVSSPEALELLQAGPTMSSFCLRVPRPFYEVGQWYRDSQVSEQDGCPPEAGSRRRLRGPSLFQRHEPPFGNDDRRIYGR